MNNESKKFGPPAPGQKQEQTPAPEQAEASQEISAAELRENLEQATGEIDNRQNEVFASADNMIEKIPTSSGLSQEKATEIYERDGFAKKIKNIKRKIIALTQSTKEKIKCLGRQCNFSEQKNVEAKDMLGLVQKMIHEAEGLEIKESDRDKEGNLLVAPDGPISNLGRQGEIYWKIARTEAFKSFFGDWQNSSRSSSKIVDQNGEPLIVFRGAHEDISLNDFYNREFYRNSNDATGAGRGVHVTPSKTVASRFADERGMKYLFVNSRKPVEQNSIKRGWDEMVNEILYIPRKYFKIPQFSLGLYDSVLGVNRNLVMADKSVLPGSKKLEDLYEIVVQDPYQILVLPDHLQEKSDYEHTVISK